MKSLYTPRLARVKSIVAETRDVRTLRLALEDAADPFDFTPGQFVELSVPRAGEATFCIASCPGDEGVLECSVKRVGAVTEAIHMLDPESLVGIRGPYGNGFPMDTLKGKDLLFVGGGIGLAPLRGLIREVLRSRDDYGGLAILYGARTAADRVYKDELDAWQGREDVRTVLTVDPGGELPDWKGRVGYVPDVLREMAPKPDDSVAVVCGPPIMIRLTLAAFDELGFDPERVLTSLELKMKCGVGQCGRCNVGPLYVCKDGPVFTCAQIKEFMEDIL